MITVSLYSSHWRPAKLNSRLSRPGAGGLLASCNSVSRLSAIQPARVLSSRRAAFCKLRTLAVSTAAFVLVDLITAVTLLAGGRSELSAIALRAVQELALSLPLLIVCHPVLAFLHRKFTL